MPTTIHIPDALLARLDQRAGELRMNRNRFIIRALEQSLREETEWSPGFLEALAEAGNDVASHAMVDELREAVRKRRTSKRAPRL